MERRSAWSAVAQIACSPASAAGSRATSTSIRPFYRVGFVVLTLLGGAGILIYLAAALVMPDEGQEDSFATAALRNRRDRPVAADRPRARRRRGRRAALAGDALAARRRRWILLLIAGAAILWITRHRRRPADGGRGRPLATPRTRVGIATLPSKRLGDRARHAARAPARGAPRSSRPRSTSISATASATARYVVAGDAGPPTTPTSSASAT